MSGDYQKLPHAGIRQLQPYIPGKPIRELELELGITDIIKLASNENPLGCSPLVQQALAGMSPGQIAAYPAPNVHPLKQRLSQKLKVSEASIILGNGSDMLFTVLLTTFGLHRNKPVLTHDKAFMTYGIQAQTLGIPMTITPLRADWQVDIDALIAASREPAAMIILANPNNPTGSLIPLTEIKRLLAGMAESTILVMDEAYYEFAYPAGDSSSLALLDSHPNLVITRTFSKAYGLAGLRLGYAIASPEIIALLQRVQLPFAVNEAALEAALAALEDDDFVSASVAVNAQGLIQLRAGLESLSLTCLPSSCNFITFDCGMDGQVIYQGLLKQGIIVRPLTPYGLTNFLRVSVGKPEQNARFLDSIAVLIEQNRKENA